MDKKITFKKQQLISVHVSAKSDSRTREQFTAEWRKDKSVNVRTFQRVVRAGGCGSPVVVVVVRRKTVEATNRPPGAGRAGTID